MTPTEGERQGCHIGLWVAAVMMALGCCEDLGEAVWTSRVWAAMVAEATKKRVVVSHLAPWW